MEHSDRFCVHRSDRDADSRQCGLRFHATFSAFSRCTYWPSNHLTVPRSPHTHRRHLGRPQQPGRGQRCSRRPLDPQHTFRQSS
jgi:hypothetical protein